MICGDLVACPPVLSAVILLEKTRKKKITCFPNSSAEVVLRSLRNYKEIGLGKHVLYSLATLP